MCFVVAFRPATESWIQPVNAGRIQQVVLFSYWQAAPLPPGPKRHHRQQEDPDLLLRSTCRLAVGPHTPQQLVLHKQLSRIEWHTLHSFLLQMCRLTSPHTPPWGQTSGETVAPVWKSAQALLMQNVLVLHSLAAGRLVTSTGALPSELSTMAPFSLPSSL